LFVIPFHDKFFLGAIGTGATECTGTIGTGVTGTGVTGGRVYLFSIVVVSSSHPNLNLCIKILFNEISMSHYL
jgi:hypothetical protein